MLRKIDFKILQTYPAYTIKTLAKDTFKKNYKLFLNFIFLHFKDTTNSKPDSFFFSPFLSFF